MIISKKMSAAPPVNFLTIIRHTHHCSQTLLWVRLLNLQNLYQQPFAILRSLGILLAIYAACTLLDFVRQGLFAITIDKHRGHWFELLWNKASSWTTA